jgi:hypothetical protein
MAPTRPGSNDLPPGRLLSTLPQSFIDPDEPLSEPRAAFRLGYLIPVIWRLRRLYWALLLVDRGEDGVSHAVSLIEDARSELINVIPLNVSQELLRVLQEWQDWYRLDVARRKESDDHSLDASTAPGSWDKIGWKHWRKLKRMADQALSGAPSLRPWYRLGALLGDYRVGLVDHLLSDDSEHDLKKLPDVRPLVRHIASLPPAYLDQLPLLGSVAEQAPVLDQSGQSTFLAMLGEWEESGGGHASARREVVKIDESLGMLVDDTDRRLGSIKLPEPVGEGRRATPDVAALAVAPDPGAPRPSPAVAGESGADTAAREVHGGRTGPESEAPPDAGEAAASLPAPGYLGLIVDEGRHQLRRVGWDKVVDLGRGLLNLNLVKYFVKRRDFLTNLALLEGVWEASHRGKPEPVTVRDKISKLNKLLRKLGVEINSRSSSWKLVALEEVEGEKG